MGKECNEKGTQTKQDKQCQEVSWLQDYLKYCTKTQSKKESHQTKALNHCMLKLVLHAFYSCHRLCSGSYYASSDATNTLSKDVNICDN